MGPLVPSPALQKKKEQEKKNNQIKLGEQQSVNVDVGYMARYGFPSVPARNKAPWFA